jgi:predicted transcriptional regulator
MNLQSEKEILLDWISNLEDESIIEKLKMIRENLLNFKDWWDELSDEQKRSIEQGLKDAEEGRVVPYEQVKEEVKKWLTKSSSRMKQ